MVSDTAVCTSDDCKTVIKEQDSLAGAKRLLEVPHPNIVRIRDVFTKKDKVYTSCEFCDGGTLAEELEMMESRGKIL